MAISDIYGVVQSLNFSTSSGSCIINVSGDVYAIAYSGTDSDGWLATVTITSTGNYEGTISALIDTLEFADGIGCFSPKIIHIAGDIYAIAYIDNAGDVGRIVTVQISDDGTIVGIVDGPDTFKTVIAQCLDFIKAAAGIYAVCYSTTGWTNNVATIGISDVGAIGAVIDTQVLTAGASDNYCIINIDSTVFAILYRAQNVLPNTGIHVSTIDIDGVGAIILLNTLKLTDLNDYPKTILNIPGTDFYAITYRDASSDGWLVTLGIDNAGNIDAAITDSLDFEPVSCIEPTICHIAGDFFALAWRNSVWSGQVATIDIDNIGAIGATLLDQHEYDSLAACDPQILLASSATTGLLIVTSFVWGGAGGWIHTVGLGTWLPPAVTTEPVSSVLTPNAVGNGIITDLGIPNVYEHGVCWNDTGAPTTSDSHTSDGVGSNGPFASDITNLIAGQTYYVRAYVITPLGTYYGADVQFTTARPKSSMMAQYAFICPEDTGLSIVDITNIKTPKILCRLQHSPPCYLEGAYKVEISGNYAYVLDNWWNYLTIVDISYPVAPKFVSSLSIGFATAIKIKGNYAFIAGDVVGGNPGVIAVDISDPSSPTIVGSLEISDLGFWGAGSSGWTGGIYVTEKYAYIVAASLVDLGNLSIVDISNPTSLSLVGTLTGEIINKSKDVIVDGKYAYIAACDGGPVWDGAFAVVDVSNPAKPVLVGSIIDSGAPDYTMYGPQGLFKVEDIVYVCGDYYHFYKIDVSNPALPTSVSAISWGLDAIPKNPMQVIVKGKYAYVTTQAGADVGSSGIVVINTQTMLVVGSLFGGSGVPPFLYHAYGIALSVRGIKGSPLVDEIMFRTVAYEED